MLSSGVTNASKKRQVRLAISLRARTSASDSRTTPVAGARLDQQAMAGAASHAPTQTNASGHVSRLAKSKAINRAAASATLPAMRR